MRHLVFKTSLAILLLQLPYPHAAQAAQRTVVHSQAELPQHSYRLSTPTASELLDGGPALDALAAQLRTDTEATLRDYDIPDKRTLRLLYSKLSSLALLRGDVPAVSHYSQKIRALSDNPASRVLVGIEAEAAAATLAAGTDTTRAHELYREHLSKAIHELPWDVVGEELLRRKAGHLMPGAKVQTIGMVQSTLDPLVARGEPISQDMLASLLSARLSVSLLAQFKPDNVSVYRAYIQAHEKSKPDIWPARMQALEPPDTLTPVVVAVWDEGVDTALFPERLWSNPGELLDGRDDDGNGYIDDIHGIGFDENGAPATEPLVPFDQHYPGREDELRAITVGQGDAGADRDTPAADAFRKRMDALLIEEVAPLREAANFYSFFSHGTRVAAIVMQGNPAARMMVIRDESAWYRTPPPAYTPQVARLEAIRVGRIVTYLKAHGARVVNMSFGASLEEIEATLAANGVGETSEKRKALALEAFSIYADAFRTAMASAPGILFLPAAGNSNSDIRFALDAPSDIDLPNVLTVGAVDQAGDAWKSSSHGERVRIYAPGVEVESTLPGGSRDRVSGTSIAAPAVTNLAAKLLAINPSLTPEQLVALILEGASTSDEGKYRLLNPRHSIALLRARGATVPQANRQTSTAR
ncbi:S8 family serine peptidase [Thermomonas sp.]|uniref:S8 family serine peptidase n=1 Tax=Thermomonas sp. TaxID=1971895 RepID=UPI002486DB7F|nr:S8 family serine peptidase [Thermomonas sp.]MDI1252359.1 S8 family serine peptidase [Thermomonas sp.]